MPIIIAHEETCDIVVRGPTQDAELGMTCLTGPP